MEGVRVRFVLHPNAHVAAAMGAALGGVPGIDLVEPCGHGAMLQAMREADLVLSDSGGMQEEAPVLGVPLLVMRDKTERPEGIDDGHAILVGTNPERIIAEVRRLLADPVTLAAMSRRGWPYGDGRASARIAALVAQWLDGKQLTA
jgi:UDP-N-acetylglucosamine 2-epimerase (non-hydrolysing)